MTFYLSFTKIENDKERLRSEEEDGDTEFREADRMKGTKHDVMPFIQIRPVEKEDNQAVKHP